MNKVKKLVGVKRFAFTLAEVLITLGLIGVIAAMTLPTLNAGINKRVIETRLKADYSLIQQVLKKAEASDVVIGADVSSNLESVKNYFESAIQPNMKYSNVCIKSRGCWHDGVTYNLAGRQAYCDNPGIGIGYDIITINLLNGSTIVMDWYGKQSVRNYFGVDIATNYTITIFIDANGKNPPNVVGKDIYALVNTPDGLVPAGMRVSKEEVDKNCSKSASGNNAGYYCLRRVKENNWKIPDDIWGK